MRRRHARPDILLCHGRGLPHAILHSSRSITRISGLGKIDDALIGRINDGLNRFRRGTRDVYLAPFKGLGGDGEYGRRLDYLLARMLIAAHAGEEPDAGTGGPVHGGSRALSAWM